MILRRPLLLGFRATITIVLSVTVLTMALATVALAVVIGVISARHNAEVQFSEIAAALSDGTDELVEESVWLARQASLDATFAAPIEGSGRFHPSFGFLSGALRTSPHLLSITLAAADASQLKLTRAAEPSVVDYFRAPAKTSYVLTLTRRMGKVMGSTLTFLDSGLQPLAQRYQAVEASASSDLWYQRAQESLDGMASEFMIRPPFLNKALLVSQTLITKGQVIAIESSLEALQTLVDKQKVSRRGEVAILDGDGGVLARSKGWQDHPEWLSNTYYHTFAGRKLAFVMEAPTGDFDGEFRTMEYTALGAAALLLVVLLPFAFHFTKRLTKMMTNLSEDVDRVCRMDFAGEAPRGSRILEFDRLARGFLTMKGTLASETKALAAKTLTLADAQLKLEKIVETGMALSTEKNTEALNQKILDIAKELTDADGGTLYLFNEKENILDFNIMLNDTLGTRFGGTSGKAIPSGLKVKLYQDDGEENHHNVASHAFLTGETINIVDAYDDDRFDFSGTRKFDEMNKYRSQSFLTVPLKPMGGEVLGCLQLINAKGVDGVTIVPFTREMQRFVEALAASAATAIYNKNLLEDLEQLFDAIIDIINGAIGRKSPYTGDHCKRVPIIAKMLADVTSAVQAGPLAGFHLDAKELREFELAAKLHDVGKVTTPEYVVDKSTKLETIYNRIHEIRTRFEVLYRDAIIRRHERVIADKKQAKAADAELAAFKKTLEDEWAFLAQANMGGEFLAPDKAERIRTIGARTWLRYFDDRLGLSWEERDRLTMLALAGGLPPELPAQETLLADKPVHVFPRIIPFTTAYQKGDGHPYPFKTPVPKDLYNQGELYNLTIGKGTLTNEEHFKIKEHVMQSIYMLDQLPWPKGLELVPVIAGEHHETLVGTGYPYQRRGEELSMQSRILTLADIFEALTASDRPYKTPKTLSESVKVLYYFKKDRHIDADLFDLFLTSGLYLDYAKKYLKPEQIDEVDIGPYLGPLPS